MVFTICDRLHRLVRLVGLALRPPVTNTLRDAAHKVQRKYASEACLLREYVYTSRNQNQLLSQRLDAMKNIVANRQTRNLDLLLTR